VAYRTPAQQRELLTATITFVADWRNAKAEEFREEEFARAVPAGGGGDQPACRWDNIFD
jgi:hypothetical protein